MKKILLLGLGLIVCMTMVTNSGSAIPAFARKYDMSCSVCHSPVPKLKPYGDEFAANAYQLKDKESPRYTRETGDDKLLLMRELPLAIRIDGFARFQPKKDSLDPKTDIEWPFILKILSAGSITKDISYFLYFLMNERGEVAGVEDAFLYFHNVGNIPLDLTVGQYQVADPIYKRELRSTFEDYVIYKAKPGLSKVDLTYDRGLMAAYTLPTETDIMVSVLNGNGIGKGSAFAFDSDKYKNFFFRLAQSIDSSLLIGGLGYIGRESQVTENGDIKNSITMIGADASVSHRQLELCGQFVYRKDSNPFFTAPGQNVATRGGFAQLTFAPDLDKSDWYLFLLYNNVDSDLKDLKYHSVAGNFTYLLARNLKLIGEYGYDIERKYHALTVGFMTAF